MSFPERSGSVAGATTDDPSFGFAGNGLKSDRSDVAVVQLAAPVSSSRYALLPPVGYDATLPNSQAIDNVGYGVQDAATQSGYGVRQLARQRVVGHVGSKDGFLKISSGTVCFGDSGGPNLQAGTDLVLAVNGYGASATCNATSYSQRLDTPEAHAFVAAFLP